MATMHERGLEVIKEIGNQPFDARARYPNLPAEQAEDVGRKLVEFCFGDTWGRPGSAIHASRARRGRSDSSRTTL